MASSKAHLRIIQLNDVYKLDNFPRVKTLVDRYSSPSVEVLVCLAGDFVAPSLLSSLDRGHSMVDVMGASGITHVCLGNHEADIPIECLKERIQESRFQWINSNMRSLDECLCVETKEYAVIEVGAGAGVPPKRVALLGFLTDDSSLYREWAFGGATSSMESVPDSAERLVSSLNDIDLFVPLTHQDIPQDVELAKRFGRTFPSILGGHDHCVYDETFEGSRIVKTGMDAHNVAIHDYVWSDAKQLEPTVTVEMVSVDSFEADPSVQHLVHCHSRILHELEEAKLFKIDTFQKSHFSTLNNRYGPTEASTILTTIVRRGLGAECALINAGGIRGNKDYCSPCDSDWFTFSDLKSEFPFRDPFCTVRIPGKVLQDAIVFSRLKSYEDPPKEASGFLHTCDSIVFDAETLKIERIQRRPFEPETLYNTAISIALLKYGMDKNLPLLKWVKEKNVQVDDDVGKPVKVIFVEYFALSVWLGFGSFNEIDKDGDGVLSRDDLKQAFTARFGSEEVSEILVDDAMAVADLDNDGFVDLHEMLAVQLTANMLHQTPEERRRRRPTQILRQLASENLERSLNGSFVSRTLDEVKKLSVSGEDDWHSNFNRNELASQSLLAE